MMRRWCQTALGARIVAGVVFIVDFGATWFSRETLPLSSSGVLVAGVLVAEAIVSACVLAAFIRTVRARPLSPRAMRLLGLASMCSSIPHVACGCVASGALITPVLMTLYVFALVLGAVVAGGMVGDST